MKYWIYSLAFFFLLFSCTSTSDKPKEKDTEKIITSPTKPTPAPAPAPAPAPTKRDICWQGKLDDKIPVFIHYQVDNELLVGEITYLNTKEKRPIRLIGSMTQDTAVSLTEYSTTGNITGMMYGTMKGDSYIGYWSAPGQEKDLKMELTRKDTLIASENFAAEASDIFGDYSYGYGEDGYQGDLSLKPGEGNKVNYEIFSVTRAPGRNIADQAGTFDSLATEYDIPVQEGCKFKMICYKDFIQIVNLEYDNCFGVYGHNATIEGTFIKIKK